MTARMSLLPRWMHRLYASVGGYFWLPCPLCKRPFGGHEWRGSAYASIPVTNGSGHVGICNACAKEER